MTLGWAERSHKTQRGYEGKRGQRLLTRPSRNRCLNTTACRHKNKRERSWLSTHSEIYLVKLIMNSIPPILTRRFSVPTGPYHKKQRHRNPGNYCTAMLALRTFSRNVRPILEPNITWLVSRCLSHSEIFVKDAFQAVKTWIVWVHPPVPLS